MSRNVSKITATLSKKGVNRPVGRRPWGIAMTPDGRTLYTANGLSGDVSVIDVARRATVATIRTGEGAWGVTIAR